LHAFHTVDERVKYQNHFVEVSAQSLQKASKQAD